MAYGDNEAVLKSIAGTPMKKKKKSDTPAGKKRKAKGMKRKGMGLYS